MGNQGGYIFIFMFINEKARIWQFAFATHELCRFPVSEDRMHTLGWVFDHMCVKKTRTLPAIFKAYSNRCSTQTGQYASSKKALKIDAYGWFELSDFLN